MAGLTQAISLTQKTLSSPGLQFGSFSHPRCKRIDFLNAQEKSKIKQTARASFL